MILLGENFYSNSEKLTIEDFNSFETDKNIYLQALEVYNAAVTAYENSDKGNTATQIFNTAKTVFNEAEKA